MIEKFGEDLYLLEKIAAGGMAEVYRAKQMGYGGFEKTVALKRILPNFAQNDEFKQMFRMEANLSGSLQHQNIAAVFGNGEWNSYLFLIMEFIDGKNVRQILARADKKKLKIPIELSLYIVAESARGLQYAHDFVDEKTGQHLEVVHRDMSPQNIMLGYDSSVKVVDFGIAKAAARSGQTRAGVLKGKFGYMSPEQAQGMNIDRRTDIFALGIILFELLTQRRLFTAEDDLKTLQLVRDCKVPRPSKYNPEVKESLDAIVMKALSKERSDRFETAGELYAEITRYLVQNHPKFLPTDLGKFVKSIFEEDIKEEKRRRDKINAELPARVATAPKKTQSVKIEAAQEESQDFGENNTPPTASQLPTDLTEKTEKAGEPEITATAKTDSLSDATQPDLPSQELPARPKLPAAPGSKKAPAELTLMSFQKEENSFRPPAAPTVISQTGSRPNANQTGISSVRLEKALNPGAYRRRKITRLALVAAGAAGLVLGGMSFINSELAQTTWLQARNQLAHFAPELSKKLEPCLDPSQGPCDFSRSPASEDMPEPKSIDVVETSQPPPAQAPSNVVDAQVSEARPIQAPSQPTPKLQSKDVTLEKPVPMTTPNSEEKRIPTQATGATLKSQTNPQGAASVDPAESFKPLKPSEIPTAVVGYVTITSTPEANEIYLNDRLLVDENEKPLRTPLKDFPLPPGKYRLHMKSTFFEVQYKGEFTIQKNKINTVEIFLKK
jgi:serine/threonine protein kinase